MTLLPASRAAAASASVFVSSASRRAFVRVAAYSSFSSTPLVFRSSSLFVQKTPELVRGVATRAAVKNVCGGLRVAPGLSSRVAGMQFGGPGILSLNSRAGQPSRHMSTKIKILNQRKRKMAKQAKGRLSTNKSVKKRFRITAYGNIKYKRAGIHHFLRNKRGRVRRKLRRGGIYTTGKRRSGQFNVLRRRVAYAWRKKD